MKLVSIAMATYNGEKYLLSQLKSIEGQTYQNIELIIVDDCSTDGTKKILLEFQQKHQSYVSVYFSQVNCGLVKNFEKALGYCNGDLVALCDQDDVWERNKVERLVEEIGGYSLIYSDVSLIDEAGITLVSSRTKKYNLNNRSGMAFEDLLFKNYIAGCTALFKRSLLVDMLPIPDNAIFHDWWVAIVASKAYGIKYLGESLVGYRQHEGNVYGHIKGGVLKHAKSLFRQDGRIIDDYQKKKLRLESMRRHHIFTKLDRKLIDDAIGYYRAYTQRENLFRHWALVVKYYPRITTKRCRFKSIFG